jgi:hypothetical protein
MTTTTTDYVLGSLALLFFFNGWRKGLFRSLISPLSLAFCSIGAIIYYDLTENLIKSLLIAGVGSMIVSTVLRILLFFGRRAVDTNYRNSSLIFSRILGGVCNLGWNGAIILILLFFVTFIPFNFLKMGDIKNDIQQSRSFHYLNSYLIYRIPVIKDIPATIEKIQKPENLGPLKDSREYKDFANSPEIMELVQDPNIQTILNQKDYTRFLAHPKVRAIMNNEKLMLKFSRLSKKFYTENFVNEESPKP